MQYCILFRGQKVLKTAKILKKKFQRKLRTLIYKILFFSIIMYRLRPSRSAEQAVRQQAAAAVPSTKWRHRPLQLLNHTYYFSLKPLKSCTGIMHPFPTWAAWNGHQLKQQTLASRSKFRSEFRIRSRSRRGRCLSPLEYVPQAEAHWNGLLTRATAPPGGALWEKPIRCRLWAQATGPRSRPLGDAN